MSKTSDWDCQILVASVEILRGHKILTRVIGISRVPAGPILTPAWESLTDPDPLPVSRVEIFSLSGEPL